MYNLLQPPRDLTDEAGIENGWMDGWMDNVIPTKTIHLFPNDKSWVKKGIKTILNRKGGIQEW